MTNDYDEVVLEANWGLGTSVVEGLVSPDHFVVDKVNGQVVEERLGAKDISAWVRLRIGMRPSSRARCSE